MKRMIEMPEVAGCSVVGCAYNVSKECHARGINVGGPLDHQCDTACEFRNHTHNPSLAGVGACKAVDCKFNQDLECQADSIRVGLSAGQTSCLTYAQKQ